MKLEGLKINFLGDSITEGVGASSPDTCYVALMGSRYGAVCRNYGISGTRLARQTVPVGEPSFEQDFCGRVEAMDPDADAVVVFGGTNDFGHGDAPLGSFDDRTQDTFYGALHTLYSSLMNRFPTAQIVIMTPLHRWNEADPRGDGFRQTPTAPLLAYVQAVRQVAEYYSLPVLDLYATSGMQPAVPVSAQLHFVDGLHPSDAGHRIIAHKLAQYLKAL